MVCRHPRSSIAITSTTGTLQPAVDTKNTAPVSSIEDLATSTPEPESVDAAQEATAAKYRKMLQMQVPKEAVRQKMMVDGVDPESVRLVVLSRAYCLSKANELGYRSIEDTSVFLRS
jgi:hypothetical protein